MPSLRHTIGNDNGWGHPLVSLESYAVTWERWEYAHAHRVFAQTSLPEEATGNEQGAGRSYQREGQPRKTQNELTNDR